MRAGLATGAVLAMLIATRCRRSGRRSRRAALSPSAVWSLARFFPLMLSAWGSGTRAGRTDRWGAFRSRDPYADRMAHRLPDRHPRLGSRGARRWRLLALARHSLHRLVRADRWITRAVRRDSCSARLPVGCQLYPFWRVVTGRSCSRLPTGREVARRTAERLARANTRRATSLGLANWQALRAVILPQCARRGVIPSFVNNLLSTFRDTSLVRGGLDVRPDGVAAPPPSRSVIAIAAISSSKAICSSARSISSPAS